MKKHFLCFVTILFCISTSCFAAEKKADPSDQWMSAKDASILFVKQIKAKYDISALDKSSKKYTDYMKAKADYEEAATSANRVKEQMIKGLTQGEKFNASFFEQYQPEMGAANVLVNDFFNSADTLLVDPQNKRFAYGSGKSGSYIALLPKIVDLILALWKEWGDRNIEEDKRRTAGINWINNNMTWPEWEAIK